MINQERNLTEKRGRRILPIPETCDRLGISRSTLRRLELADLFPKRVRRGRRGVGHFEDEVDAYQEDLERIELEGK